MSEWISVKNRLPPLGKKVVVQKKGEKTISIMRLGYSFIHDDINVYSGYRMCNTEDELKKVDFIWCLLPEPPNE